MELDEFGIVVKQICSLDINPNTGRADIVKINYEITNNDSNIHDVGIRIMLDTMLGDNDGAPFKVPGYENITTEIEMTGAYVPQYWQVFDDFDNPTVIASGTLFKTFNEKPDKVQFASWTDIRDTLWDYPITSGKNITNDSAVAVYYYSKPIDVGSTKNIATYYGIGDFSTSGDSENLSIRVTAPQELTVNTTVGNYYSNPYTITCYIKNNSADTIQNAVAELILPDSSELIIPAPGSKIVNIGDIAPGEEKTIAYSVLAVSQSVDKTLNYSINVTADNCSTKNIPLSITLPQVTTLEDASISINKTTLNLEVNQTETLHAELINIDGSVTWLSSKPSVAKVNSNGLITAISPGISTITASAGGKSASCVVTVIGTPITLHSISIAPTAATININEAKVLAVSCSPANAPNKQIRSWTSSRPDIAAVSGGRVVGLKAGTTVITAVAQDGNKQATCTITVVESEPILSLGEGISFEQQVSGPNIKFAGKTFPLFMLNIGTELKLGDHVKLVYNPTEDNYVAYFGDMHEKTGTNDTNPDGTLTEAAKQLRRDTYSEIKRLMSMVGKQTNRDFYNAYRSFVKKNSPWSVSGNKTAFGYVEFVRSNGKYVLSDGEVCVLFEAGVGYKYCFPPAPAVYLTFDISGSLQTGLKLKLRTKGVLNSGVDVYGKVEGNLTPSLGVGGDILVANVEGGIEGTVNSVIELDSNNTFMPERDLQLSLSGNLYLKYKVFLFINGKSTYPLGRCQIYPPEKNVARLNTLMAINSNSMDLMSRDYLNKTEFTANDRISCFRAMLNLDFNANYETTNVITNTYPYGEPQIISIGDNKYLLVYIGDVDSRTTENRTGLYYSVFNGQEWSIPKLVCDDGTADFSPMLARSGNDVYVAWQNIEKTLNEGVLLEDYSLNTGIDIARFNGNAFAESQSLTNSDGFLDGAPIITASDEQIAVVWVKNNENDVFGFDGKNSIYRSVFNEDSWSQVESVVDDAGFIGQLASSFDGSDNIIVYTKDIDNDFETIEDRELMLVKGNESPVAITNNEVDDNNAVLIDDETGISLYWSSGDKLYYSKSVDDIIPVEIENASGESFKVLANGSKKAIVWEQSTGYASELFGMFFDNGLWGSPVQITDNGNRIRETAGFIEDDGSIYLSYMSAEINTIEDNEDIDPTGDTALVVAKLTPACDLKFGSSIAFDESQILPNGVVTLSTYVQNLGQAAVSDFIVKLSNENGAISSFTINTPLASGEGTYIDIPYTLPDTLVKHKVILTLEPIGSNDCNLSNNVTEATIGEAVIKVLKPKIAGMGNSRTVTATIVNNGYTPSQLLTVNLYRNRTDTEPLYTQSVVSVPAKSSRIVEFTLPIKNDSFINGDCLIYVGVNDGMSEMFNYTVMRMPEQSSSLTISSVAQVGNVVLFNIDNNLSKAVSGTLLISSKDNYDNQVAQSVYMDSLGSQSIQLDVTSLQEENALSIRVLDDDDSVISNIVNVFNNGSIQLEKPIVIPEAGTYANTVLVTLYSDDPLAKIYYTVDESIPSITNGTEYTGAFIISETSVVKAIAVKEGMESSEITSVAYTISIKVTGVALDKTEMTLTAGGSQGTLEAIVSPNNATNKNVTWSSSNDDVASVDNGIVTPVSEGIATITVMTDDGCCTATCLITVNTPSAPTQYALTIAGGNGGTITTGDSGDYARGDKINIEAKPNSGYRFVNWTSSNGGIFGDVNSSKTTFTMPANVTILTANFSLINAGTGNSGSRHAKAPVVDWNSIKSDINLAKDGDTIKVDMKSETTVPSNIFESLKGKNINLIFKMDSYAWTINGRNVKKLPTEQTSINLKISTISEANLSVLAEKKDILQIELAHNGAFPFTATLEFKVGTLYSGKRVFLYYYNEATKKLEYRIASIVDKNDRVVFEINHDSKYVLTIDVLAGTYIRDNTIKILGSDPNSLVPFYVENGKEILVSLSSISDDSIVFVAPKTTAYDYKNNIKNFTDIENHWSKNNISFVTARELFSGIGNNKFGPDETMTRAMFVTVLGRLYGMDTSAYNYKTLFTDVDSNAWYAPYVTWAIEKGIVKGVGDNKFAPDTAITREQMAVIIINYAKLMGITLPRNNDEIVFVDSENIALWASNAVKTIQKAGVINGKPGQIFDPKGTATRAEVSAVLKRLIEFILIK